MGTIKLAYCTWVDAFQFDEVHPVDYNFEVSPICTSGILIKEDENCVIISRDYFPSKSKEESVVRSTIAIPKSYIVKFEIIKLLDEGEIIDAHL